MPKTLEQLRAQILGLPPWLFPPANAIAFNEVNYINLPPSGTTATILSFTVPDGMNGVIKWIGNNFVGAGWIEGSGSVIWRVAADDAFVRNHENILASLGSPASPSETALIRILEHQTIQLQIDNISVVIAGQLVGGRLSGWYYPLSEEEDTTWL